MAGRLPVLRTEYIVLSTGLIPRPSPRPSPSGRGRPFDPFRNAQLRAAAARISMNFFLSRPDRLFRQSTEPRIGSKGFFDAAIFERMKADDRQAAAWLE